MKHSNRQDQRPSMQFYPKDWLSDFELNQCSLAAQGLWVRLLCAMFLSETRGVICSTDARTLCETAARVAGRSVAEVEPLLTELLGEKVAEESDDGHLYNRRMRREWEDAERRSEQARAAANAKWERKRNAQPMPKDAPSTPVAPAPAPNAPYDDVLWRWNVQAEKAGFAKFRAFSEKRKKKLAVRWKEWGADGEAWGVYESILSALSSIPFYCGKTKEGYRATIDLILRDDTKWRGILEQDDAQKPTEKERWQP